jgi:hypothetical protein
MPDFGPETTTFVGGAPLRATRGTDGGPALGGVKTRALLAGFGALGLNAFLAGFGALGLNALLAGFGGILATGSNWSASLGCTL